MNIIIVGAGEIGRHIAIRLSSENHAIVVIDHDETVANELDHRIDAKVLNAEGASVNTLVDAGVSDCELFLALTSDNNINMVACSMAKTLGARQVVCRVHPDLQREEFLFDFRSHFGIDYLFSSERLTAIELAKFIRNPDSIFVEQLARGHIELQQLTVSSESRLTNQPLKNLDFPSRVRVGTIRRGEKSFIPGPSEVLLANDQVMLFGEPKALHETVLALQKADTHEAQANIVIFGGDEYGFSLAQTLEGWNCRVRILEADADRCAELTELLPNATVLNTDGTSLAELKEEKVGEADFFIAVTDVDEDNVMTCLQAQTLGAKNCLTLIHRADYADAMNRLGDRIGIQAAISPRNATGRDLERFLTSDRFHLVRKIDAGELIETRVAKGSTVDGRLIREVKWPEQCLLVALMHGLRATAPAADDKMVAGDFLYAVVSAKARRKLVKLVSK